MERSSEDLPIIRCWLWADKVVDAVKSGAVKGFVVMAGCDGRRNHGNIIPILHRHYQRTVLFSLQVVQNIGIINWHWEILGVFPGCWMPGNVTTVILGCDCPCPSGMLSGLKDVNELPIVYNIACMNRRP